MIRNLALTIVLSATLIAGGTGVAWLLYASQVEPSRIMTEVLPPMVSTLIARLETVTEEYVGYGTARADREAKLAAEVTSTVKARGDDLRDGARVVENQVLLRLDDREYRHALSRAEAIVSAARAAIQLLEVEQQELAELTDTAKKELRVAESERRRLSRLMEDRMAVEVEVNATELDYLRTLRILQGYERETAKIVPRRTQLEASLRGHEAAVQTALINLERCVIRAPFAGQIEQLLVNKGDTVTHGMLLLTLVDASVVQISVQVPARIYDRVTLGSPCRISSDSVPGSDWRAAVERVAPSVDPGTRTFSLYVRVDNREQEFMLVPGMFVRVVVEGPTLSDRVILPRSAVREGTVLIVTRDTVERRAVVVDRYVGERAVLAEGVAAGERVIVSSLSELAEGARVRTHDIPAFVDAGP